MTTAQSQFLEMYSPHCLRYAAAPGNEKLSLSPFSAWAKSLAVVDGIDQDQSALNVQSDLGSISSAC